VGGGADKWWEGIGVGLKAVAAVAGGLGGHMCMTGSGAHEWAGRAGVRKFPISGGPITFGGQIGKNRQK
jgi:hypothetical protein